MEDNKNTELEKDVETKGKDGSDSKSETTDTNDDTKETVTMSKSDYDKGKR